MTFHPGAGCGARTRDTPRVRGRLRRVRTAVPAHCSCRRSVLNGELTPEPVMNTHAKPLRSV